MEGVFLAEGWGGVGKAVKPIMAAGQQEQSRVRCVSHSLV